MKFDFNQSLINLNGTPAEDNLGEKFTLAKTLANNLSFVQKFSEPVKLLEWCRALWNGGVIDLDKTDQKKFRDVVVSFDKASSFVVGQILEHFDETQNKKPETKEVVVESISANGVAAAEKEK